MKPIGAILGVNIMTDEAVAVNSFIIIQKVPWRTGETLEQYVVRLANERHAAIGCFDQWKPEDDDL
jgi:hypothetical protein